MNCYHSDIVAKHVTAGLVLANIDEEGFINIQIQIC
jgi:hypothetical protein